MLEIFLFVFGVIGLTDIVVESDIFEPARKFLKEKVLPEEAFGIKWHTILSCHQCCGQWCGFIMGPLTIGPFVWFQSELFVLNWLACFVSMIINLFLWFVVCGPAGSALATWSFILKDYILSQTTFNISEETNEQEVNSSGS